MGRVLGNGLPGLSGLPGAGKGDCMVGRWGQVWAEHGGGG